MNNLRLISCWSPGEFYRERHEIARDKFSVSIFRWNSFAEIRVYFPVKFPVNFPVNFTVDFPVKFPVNFTVDFPVEFPVKFSG